MNSSEKTPMACVAYLHIHFINSPYITIHKKFPTFISIYENPGHGIS